MDGRVWHADVREVEGAELADTTTSNKPHHEMKTPGDSYIQQFAINVDFSAACRFATQPQSKVDYEGKQSNGSTT